jgi:hypothetical protein
MSSRKDTNRCRSADQKLAMAGWLDGAVGIETQAIRPFWRVSRSAKTTRHSTTKSSKHDRLNLEGRSSILNLRCIVETEMLRDTCHRDTSYDAVKWSRLIRLRFDLGRSDWKLAGRKSIDRCGRRRRVTSVLDSYKRFAALPQSQGAHQLFAGRVCKMHRRSRML